METQGDVSAAISQYQQALNVAPDDPRTLISLARLYDRQDEFQLAESLYRRAITTSPDHATAYNDLGMCYTRRGMHDAALPLLQRAAGLQPLNALYRNNLAIVLVELGRTDEAFQHLAAVGGEAVAHYNLGFLLWQRQGIQQARQHFEWALQKDPSLAAAGQMLDRIQTGSRLPGRSPATSVGHERPDHNAIPATTDRQEHPIRLLPPV